ncbi:MAG TPA: protein kinase, partial [Gammaproteobacteria bacterium]|nr:protein kinase [Gammaproteobacteria bacterium]
MAAVPGTRLGAYEITGVIGAGGMGEVYRARDTKLGREVAIKTLPSALAQDPDRLARFEREAKLLAALNHAHIGAIYGLDEHEGIRFIAMELIEGQTLEEKLKDGALPVEDALRIALQIAEALEAAHEKGVVHRDLKPANVMLTRDSVVKVLDFGLAKAFAGNPNEASPAHSPALSLAMTKQGLILGTAGYMSPEQASGQATDQRADIWAFGVVLYEMLAGQPLFSGESVPHILADVLRTEPDWSRLPKRLHPRLKLMLERCLAKKPRNRLHAIADARVEIEVILRDPHEAISAAATAVESRSPVWRRLLPMAAAVIAAVVITGLGVRAAMQPAPQPVNRFDYDLPEGQVLRNTGRRVIALSPSGRYFAYNAVGGIYLRTMGELEPRLVSGTEPALTNPSFSPDGQSLVYSSVQALQRIAISGGAPVVIAAVTVNPTGVSWEADGTILFA